jgi:hypothetical protein
MCVYVLLHKTPLLTYLLLQQTQQDPLTQSSTLTTIIDKFSLHLSQIQLKINYDSRVMSPKVCSLTNMLIIGVILFYAVLKGDAHKTTTGSTIIPAGFNTPSPVNTVTLQTGFPPVESVRTICRTITHSPNYDTTIPTTYLKTTQTTTTTSKSSPILHR